MPSRKEKNISKKSVMTSTSEAFTRNPSKAYVRGNDKRKFIWKPRKQEYQFQKQQNRSDGRYHPIERNIPERKLLLWSSLVKKLPEVSSVPSCIKTTKGRGEIKISSSSSAPKASRQRRRPNVNVKTNVKRITFQKVTLPDKLPIQSLPTDLDDGKSA